MGAQLAEFTGAVPIDVRVAIADSILLAQLAANKTAGKTEDVLRWYDKYAELPAEYRLAVHKEHRPLTNPPVRRWLRDTLAASQLSFAPQGSPTGVAPAAWHHLEGLLMLTSTLTAALLSLIRRL